MLDLIAHLKGPYFSFLVVSKDEFWERCGKVQRVTGIKPEYHDHPNALRIPDCIVSIIAGAFSRASSKFNYYGYTVYEAATLRSLNDELQSESRRIDECRTHEEFDEVVTELFAHYCREAFGGWQQFWPETKNEIVRSANRIVALAATAEKEEKALLVLGI